MNLKANISRFLAVFSVAILLGVNVLAQSGTSSISGAVNDAQNNAVPGATVTLISTQNARRTTTTNTDGTFTFPGIPAGIYKVEVEGKGF
jgi:hypothetical protein